MNWKLLFAIIFIAIIGFVAARFFLSGQPWTIDGLTVYVQTGTRNTIDSATIFLTEKWQIVMTALGALTTVVLGLYRTIKSKLTAVTTTATNVQNQLGDVQTQMTQQYNTMQATITSKNQTITDLQGQLTTLQNNSTSVQQIKDQYTQLEGSIKRIQDERDYIMGQLKDALAQVEQYKPKPIP